MTEDEMNLDNIKNLSKDDLLNVLGLETRRTAVDYLVPGLTLFGVGLLVGTGVGLLVAPRTGKELREDLAKRLEDAPDAVKKLPARASDAVHRATEQIAEKASTVAERASTAAERVNNGKATA